MAKPLSEMVRNDNRYFIENILGNTLWEKQAEIVKSVIDNERTTVKSCHASGKTFTSARIILQFIHCFPHSIALTTAPTFRQVKDLLWREINTAFHSAKTKSGSKVTFPGIMLNTQYSIKNDWYAVGLSTTEPDKFQGYHSKYILVVGDEAAGIPKAIFEAVDGILSTGYIRLLLIGNPTDPTGYFADTFKSSGFNKITISCFDTPNFKNIPDMGFLRRTTEQERRDAVTHPYLITPQWVYERMVEWGEESPLFHSRCLGQFPVEADDTLIALKYAESAVRRETGEGDDIWIGLDIARFGSDRTAFVVRKGNEVIEIEWFSKEDTMRTVGRAVNYLMKYPSAKLNIDVCGVGGGVVDRLNEIGFESRIYAIDSATKADQYAELKFVNTRAELYWRLRERFLNYNIKLLDRGSILNDLTNLKYKFRSSDGAIQIESKEELKKRGLRSPDLADALMLSFADGFSTQPNIRFI